MILYHGSNGNIEKIDLALSRPNKDFGRGFYLTEDKEQAMRMGEQKVLQLGGTSVVNSYYFDEAHLTDGSLSVKIFEGYSEEWAEFIVANRSRKTKGLNHDYDVVIGAIADDKVGVQLFRYMKEYIDLPALIRNLQYVKLTTQYYFGTERAITLLEKQ